MRLVILIIIAIWLFMVLVLNVMHPGDAGQPTRSAADTSAGGATSPVSAPAPTPVLEVLGWHWGRTGGGSFVEAQGQVQNLTTESLRNIQAVVTFFDRDGGFITSSKALITYNPLLPGQISPFRVIETFNPAMQKAQLEFATLFGGTLVVKEREKPLPKAGHRTTGKRR